MYRQFGNADYRNGFAGPGQDSLTVAQSGQLDALVILERIATRLNFTRNDEIYAEGDSAECWYKVVPGTDETRTRILRTALNQPPARPVRPRRSPRERRGRAARSGADWEW